MNENLGKMSLKELLETHKALKERDQERAHGWSDDILVELLLRCERMVDGNMSDTIGDILHDRKVQSQKWWWA